jgi:pilus assembly protein CpaF
VKCGIETRTLLDSFIAGHPGSLATIHANSTEKALRSFANLLCTTTQRPPSATWEQRSEKEIGEAVGFVVHVERQPGRRIPREVLGLRGSERGTQRSLIDPVFEQQHAAA